MLMLFGQEFSLTYVYIFYYIRLLYLFFKVLLYYM